MIEAEPLQIDFLAMLIAMFVNRIIYYTWYSSYLFGPLKKLRPWRRLAELGLIVVMTYILAWLSATLVVTTVSDGMFLGSLIWIGFYFTFYMAQVLHKKIEPRAFLIDGGYWLLSLLVMGGILGA